MTKRHIGVGLVVAAALLVGAALFLWQAESAQVDDDQLAEEYRAASLGVPAEDIEPNRVPSLALAGLATVLFLGGVIVLVSPSPDS